MLPLQIRHRLCASPKKSQPGTVQSIYFIFKNHRFASRIYHFVIHRKRKYKIKHIYITIYPSNTIRCYIHTPNDQNYNDILKITEIIKYRYTYTMALAYFNSDELNFQCIIIATECILRSTQMFISRIYILRSIKQWSEERHESLTFGALDTCSGNHLIL